ncbi:MAG: toxin-antitoxin system YwqK family antitoxin [Methylococcales bacterium]|nr:toxin-antitoxin system YwqK family antitoxin [Methylococcales bacterium]
MLANANFCAECGTKVFVKVVNYNTLQKVNNLMCYEGKPFTGSGVAYYFNGQKKHEETFNNGVGHGTWSYWYENGNKAQETRYCSNQFDGLETEWFENGQKKSEVNWSKGVLNGLWVSWYKNGQKEGEVIYNNGKKHGCETMWFENGQMYSKGNWDKAEQVGHWTVWKENGQKKWQGDCQHGELSS